MSAPYALEESWLRERRVCDDKEPGVRQALGIKPMWTKKTMSLMVAEVHSQCYLFIGNPGCFVLLAARPSDYGSVVAP